jgi:hypothetical protein
MFQPVGQSRRRNSCSDLKLTESSSLQNQQPQMCGYEGIIDDLCRCEDTLRPDPRCECELSLVRARDTQTNWIEDIQYQSSA